MNQDPSPPLIAVDVGNTSIHFGIFTHAAPPQRTGLPEPALRFCMSGADDFTPLMAWLPPMSPPWVLASVNAEWTTRLNRWVSQNRPDVVCRMLDYTQLPLSLAIEHPETAGLDRLAAAVAVNRLRDPGQPAIIVDFGTAITVDAVDSEGKFLGGAILPGLDLSLTALVAGTSQLPPVDTDFNAPPPPIGRSTEPAMRAGLFWAAVGAVRELIQRASVELGTPPLVVCTGGGGELLLPHLDEPGRILQVPHLVLSGIMIAAQNFAPDKS
jgi:type III pantothenate kinase